jgi:hypothetical protein
MPIDDIGDYLVCYREVVPGMLAGGSVSDKYLVTGITQRSRSLRKVGCISLRQWMADYIQPSEARNCARPGAAPVEVVIWATKRAKKACRPAKGIAAEPGKRRASRPRKNPLPTSGHVYRAAVAVYGGLGAQADALVRQLSGD